MPARKHNIFAIKLISILIGIVGTTITVISIDWVSVIKAGSSAIFLYENFEHLEHVVNDSHQVIAIKDKVDGLESRLDSLKKVIFITTSRDSLVHIIELLNRGKIPYDSIWRKSESGHWYLTTVKNHFESEHND